MCSNLIVLTVRIRFIQLRRPITSTQLCLHLKQFINRKSKLVI